MRVTERAKMLALKRRVQRHSRQIEESSEQIASGRRLRARDQDPVAAAQLERLRQTQARQDGFARAGQTAREELEVADGALSSAADVLRDARDLAIQLGSGPRTPGQLEAASAEVGQLFDALRGVANTSHRGQHVFGGVRSDVAPFDAAGQFQGSAQLREVDYRPGESVRQADGASAFGASGGVDAFATLDALQGALQAGDQDRARLLGDDLREALTQITGERQALGAQVDTLDQAEAFRQNMQLELDEQASALGDADIAEAATRLQLARTGFQATIEASARFNALDILRNL